VETLFNFFRNGIRLRHRNVTAPIQSEEAAEYGAPNRAMEHLAVQRADESGGTAVWQEHVTDADYAGGTAIATS
jgi:2,4-dienoyl-CoA reductase-like NADH-dependent reductase (Old Yellow Enzyme family)